MADKLQIDVDVSKLNLASVKGATEKAVGKALLAYVIDLESEAFDQVPLDDGTLRRSYDRSMSATISGNTIEVEAGYNAPYAAEVHELPQIKNPTTRETTSKFLINPVMRTLGKIKELLVDKINEDL